MKECDVQRLHVKPLTLYYVFCPTSQKLRGLDYNSDTNDKKYFEDLDEQKTAGHETKVCTQINQFPFFSRLHECKLPFNIRMLLCCFMLSNEKC